MAREFKANEQIRVRQVRLIGGEGEQLGIMDTREAIRVAREKGLDLVLVGETALPPVAKLIDYGRFRYQQAQQDREARRRARQTEMKAIKFRPKIDTHDYETKVGHVKRFLAAGNKVKVTIMFRGRERFHPEIGRGILDDVAKDVTELGVVEQMPNLQGMDMNMILAPVNPPKTQPAQDENSQGAASGG